MSGDGDSLEADQRPRFAVNCGDFMVTLRDLPWLAELWRPHLTGEWVEGEGQSSMTGAALVVDMPRDKWDACRQIVRMKWPKTWDGIRLYERHGRTWKRV